MPVADQPPRHPARRIGFGVLLGAEALMMTFAGLGKFLNPEMWTTAFVSFGYPGEMAYFIGGAEILGALLLLIPPLASRAAIGLGIIMVGALHAVLTYPNDLGWFAPTLHLAMLSVIGAVRWKRQ